MNPYSLAADLVVLVHVVYVATVIVGLLLILIGLGLGWTWVRNFWFRGPSGLDRRRRAGRRSGHRLPADHVGKRAAGEGRRACGAGDFLGRLAHYAIFCQAPEWAFVVAHCLFGGLVLAVMIFAPPRWA